MLIINVDNQCHIKLVNILIYNAINLIIKTLTISDLESNNWKLNSSSEFIWEEYIGENKLVSYILNLREQKG